MEKRILIYKKFKLVVFGKVGVDGFTPLSFNVYRNNKSVNGLISEKLYNNIEEGIYEHFANSGKLFNQ
jgi:hypothetical protein